jgi:hypothetical protein
VAKAMQDAPLPQHVKDAELDKMFIFVDDKKTKSTA